MLVMQRSLLFRVLFAAMLSVAAWGCRSDRVPLAVAPAAAPAEPYVLHLPGIGGYLPVDRSLMRGLRAGGVNGTIAYYDWTAGDPGMRALLDNANKVEQADRVAEMLIALHRADPNRPIYLIGHSGGAGIAVWALERLPETVRIQRLILLAPALSSTYDLSHALQRVEDRAYALISEHDPVLAATRVFGTIDSVRTHAAGRVGFIVPHDAGPVYDKLVQLPYRNEWMELGHLGDHIGMMQAAFAAQVLAPLIGE